VTHEQLAQGQVPFGAAVLQGRGRVLLEDEAHGRLDLRHREDLGGRKATREGDEVRLLRQLEELADHRARDSLGALGEAGSPGGVGADLGQDGGLAHGFSSVRV